MMLAVRRSEITAVLGLLQAAAVVDQQRGCVIICDRPSLEAAACGYYGSVQAFIAAVWRPAAACGCGRPRPLQPPSAAAPPRRGPPRGRVPPVPCRRAPRSGHR
jgi:hypothetical protein